MIRTDFIHKTPSSNILIDVKAAVVDSRRLAKYESKREIEKLCEKKANQDVYLRWY
jgi:hypothetical protein